MMVTEGYAEDYREVRLDELRLDAQNPRLSHDVDWDSQPEIRLLREFARKYNLIELARSIADKGFTPRHAEALLVIQDPTDGVYVVVEGNRRLATLKLLSNSTTRRQAGITNREWDELAEDAAGLDADHIPVVVYADRHALDDYLGFRHITGPTPWRPEAKARFIVKLLRQGETIADVARRIGSNHRTVRRYAEAHAIYIQALESGIRMEDAEAAFGVFYNALDQEGVRTFLGLGRQSDINSLPESPVHEDRLAHLQQLKELLYGEQSEGYQPVIRESRDLRKLGQVLANERARANILRDRDSERAWRVSGGGRGDLLGLLADIHSRLAEVNGQAPEYRDDQDVKEDVRRIYILATDTADRYGVK